MYTLGQAFSWLRGMGTTVSKFVRRLTLLQCQIVHRAFCSSYFSCKLKCCPSFDHWYINHSIYEIQTYMYNASIFKNILMTKWGLHFLINCFLGIWNEVKHQWIF